MDEERERAWTYAVIGWAVGFLCGVIIAGIMCYWIIKYAIYVQD